jgi:hypothetical protein
VVGHAGCPAMNWRPRPIEDMAVEAPAGALAPSRSPAPPGSAEARRRQAWAQRLRKVFEVEPLVCPRCGEAMVILAWITDYAVVDRIRRHRRQKGIVSVFEEDGGARAPPGS